MASFRQRKGPGGKPVWHVQIRRRGYPPQTATFDKKSEAEAWAGGIEAEMLRGQFIPRAEAEHTTLGEALDRYEKEVTQHKRASTRAREAGEIRRMKARPLAVRPLAAIRGKDLAAYIRQRQADGMGANSVRIEIALISHLYTVAASAWGMESLRNPVPLVKTARPKLPQGRTRRLVDSEESRLLEAARTYGGEIQHLIPWAIETAMRRGEIAAMHWEHLDKKARVLLIPETKTGTPRRVPLSSSALQVLEALPRQIDGRVWSLRADSISQAFERVCKAAGIEGLTFHDLRHEATSRLFEKDLNPMQVAAITGHKTLQMLKRYTHLRAEDLVGRLG